MTRRLQWKTTAPAASFLLFTSFSAFPQVRTLSLGIDVNSPYGLGEPWSDLREGLLRQDFIASVTEHPHIPTGTGEIVPRDGRLIEPSRLSDVLKSLGLGASLRGVEARITGKVEKTSAGLMLTIPNDQRVISLVSLRELVQVNPDTKERRQPTPVESSAFDKLTREIGANKMAIDVVGTLRMDKGNFVLEVRQFQDAAGQKDAGKSPKN